MAITHGTAARADLAQKILDDVDAGSPPGSLKIFNSSNTVLANVALSNPSFTRSAAVLTLAGVPLSDTSADASGTADHFEFQNAAGTKIFGGTVGTSGTDMIVDSTNFTAGQKFTINSCTYTAPN
jgi:hypothetical protein